MTKSPISPCVILLALAAIVPFGAAVSFEVSRAVSSYAHTYESSMLSQTQQVFEMVESRVNSVAEKISSSGYLQTAMNTPVVKETITCIMRKLELTKKHVIEFGQLLIKLISYARALGVEIRKCFLNAKRPGAPKVPACIMDVTSTVVQASNEYVPRLVLNAIRILAAVNGVSNTIQNCALYNN